jgi:hypothetical protein
LLILDLFFGKFSTEQHKKIRQILLKVSVWRGYNGVETGSTISCIDKKKIA